MSVAGRRWAPWLLAVASGAGLLAAFPPGRAWPLALFALAPLLDAARRAPTARVAANLGAVAGLAFYPAALSWLTRPLGPLALPVWLTLSLGMAVFCAAYWRLSRLLAKSGTGAWLEALGAGALWAGLEYLRCEAGPLELPWLALGYALSPFPPLLQGASWIGVYGLSGALAAVNAAWVLALAGRRGAATVGAAAIALLALWGAGRADRLGRPEGRRLELAAVQDETFEVEQLARASVGSGVLGGLWIWPEAGVLIQADGEAAFLELLKRRLRGPGSTAVVGASLAREDGPAEGRSEDFAWVLSRGGRLAGRYDKAHPRVFLERSRLASNPSPLPVDSPAGRLGILLGNDADFEGTARMLAAEGAELLVVPSSDPRDWGGRQSRQHSDMAPLRAVETGLWLARAASSGHTLLADPSGRIRAELPFGVGAVLTGEVFARSAATPYVRLGWLFAPACLSFVLLFLALWLIERVHAARAGK